MDLWDVLMDALLAIFVIPPWERPRPFEAASRVEDLGLRIPWDLKPSLFTSNLSDLNDG